MKKQRIAEAASSNLKCTAKLTSGNAFKREEICLTSPSILEEQLKYEKHKLEQRLAAEQQKRVALTKSKVKADRIRQKYESKWGVADYRTLLTYKKQPGDPASSKITDKEILKSMWQQRSGRASPTIDTVDTLGNSNNDEEDKLTVNNMMAMVDPLLQMPFNATTGDEEVITTSDFI